MTTEEMLLTPHRQLTDLQVEFDSLSSAPKPPPRSPLRQKSSTSLNMEKTDPSALLLEEITSLSGQVGKLSNQIYEIQELRHSTVPSIPAANGEPASRLDQLLATFDHSVIGLTPKVEKLQEQCGRQNGKIVHDELEELKSDWQVLLQSQKVLKEEMKEDGFLVRFRTAADQAENMMDTLRKSLGDCSSYVERISNASGHLPLDSEEGISIQGLSQLAARHESLKKSYVQSISKILKMMDKSITERPTKNGETLRRNGDMNQRWIGILKSLQQLDAKIRLILSQHSVQREDGEIEILVDNLTIDEEETYGFSSKTPVKFSQNQQRRDSASTGSSSASRFGLGTAPETNRAFASQTLKRQPSTISNSSKITATPTSFRGGVGIERPRWNPSTRPTATLDSVVIPTNKRITTMSQGLGLSHPPHPHRRNRDFSPTPSNASESRSEANNFNTNNNKIPNGPYMTVPRRSLSKNPPSSYRSMTPTPTSTTSPHLNLNSPRQRSQSRQEFSTSTSIPASRPHSRLSHVPSAIQTSGSTLPLQPFIPSKYDLLDQAVASIILSSGYTGFVSRLDRALQKTQRKGAGEWKGEFCFGAGGGGGEKGQSIKMLEIKAKDGSVRDKVMIRVGGAWQDLEGHLKSKMAG